MATAATVVVPEREADRHPRTAEDIERGILADQRLCRQQVRPAELAGMWSALVHVTPDVAADWLARSRQRNRHETPQRINRLMRVLMDNLWVVNGDTIVKSWDDDILNGHGRLIACSKSGVGFWSWVIFNVDPATMPTFDTNKIRSPGDDLEIAGVENAHTSASVAKGIWLARRDSLDQWQQGKDRTGFTNRDAREIATTEPGFGDSVRAGKRLNYAFRAVTVTTFAFLYHVLPEYDVDRGREFVERLADGVGLTEDSPVAVLRRRLINNQSSRAKVSATVVLGMVIKAWLAFCRGERMRSVKFGANEKFPSLDPAVAADLEPADAIEEEEFAGSVS